MVFSFCSFLQYLTLQGVHSLLDSVSDLHGVQRRYFSLQTYIYGHSTLNYSFIRICFSYWFLVLHSAMLYTGSLYIWCRYYMQTLALLVGSLITIEFWTTSSNLTTNWYLVIPITDQMFILNISEPFCYLLFQHGHWNMYVWIFIQDQPLSIYTESVFMVPELKVSNRIRFPTLVGWE